jgi:hypothetical protein
MSMKFEVVEDTLREAEGIGRGSAKPSALVQALLDEKTVFIPVEDANKINGLYDAARRRGFKFNTRKIKKDTQIGHVGWFTKKADEPASNG